MPPFLCVSSWGHLWCFCMARLCSFHYPNLCSFVSCLLRICYEEAGRNIPIEMGPTGSGVKRWNRGLPACLSVVSNGSFKKLSWTAFSISHKLCLQSHGSILVPGTALCRSFLSHLVGRTFFFFSQKPLKTKPDGVRIDRISLLQPSYRLAYRDS